jgi:hypothetical protein
VSWIKNSPLEKEEYPKGEVVKKETTPSPSLKRRGACIGVNLVMFMKRYICSHITLRVIKSRLSSINEISPQNS